MKAYFEMMKFDVTDVITASTTVCTNMQNGVNVDTEEKCEGCVED